MIGVVASFFVAAVLVGVGTLHLVFGAKTCADDDEVVELAAVGDLVGVPALAVALMIIALNSELAFSMAHLKRLTATFLASFELKTRGIEELLLNF